MAVAAHGEGFEFQRIGGDNRMARGGLRVHFGVTLANPNEDPEPGVLIASVTPGSSAAEGGVKAEDRIVKWQDRELESVPSWLRMLARHEPGDEVKFEVRRGAEVLLLKAVLRGR
jgi:S1-C subfamily serine protease